jgi:hypothetical protein
MSNKDRTTRFPNGVAAGYWPRVFIEVTANFTPTINTDSGNTYVILRDNLTITLPAIATGNVFTFINGMADGECLVTIDPNAADGIAYKGSLTDGVTLINAKLTAKRGDRVILASLESIVSWQVTDVAGIWAKGA